MSSENILQNSPALHCLKRAQLIRLCRNHGIKFKATEKNTDLIRRLQEYGRNPPLRSGSDDGSEDEGSDMDTAPQPAPRPSEAWSLIDEPSVDFSPRFSSTLSTIKEFGGGDTSSKSSSVSSSIKALANSLLHAGSSSSKVKVPAQIEPTVPIQNEPEIDAESEYSADPEPELNTSISTIYRQDPGASTIRLVAPAPQNRLSSSPEYANPSPFRGKSIIAVPSPCPTGSLYPRIPSPFTPPHHGSPETVSGSDFSQLPGAFPPPPPLRFPGYAGSSSGMSPEFTFRSPVPSSVAATSNRDAREAILEEMNRRMQLTSGENGAVGLDNLQLDTPRTKKRSRDEDEDDEQSLSRLDPLSRVRFEKLHQKQFDKMPSIADHYAAKRGSPRKSSMPSAARSSVGRRPRHSRTSVVSAAHRRSSARARPSVLKQIHSLVDGDNDELRRAAKRVRTSGVGPSDDNAPAPAFQTDTRQVQISMAPDQEKEMVTLTADAKRKADKAKARRKSRSSMGRQSMGRNAVIGSSKAKGFGSKFGFLKSSAKLVRSMYTAVVGGEHQQPPADGKKSNDKITSLPLPVAAPKKNAAPTTGVEKMPVRPTSSSVLTKPPPSARLTVANSKTAKPDAPSSSQYAAPLVTKTGYNNTSARGGSTSSRDTKISAPGTASRLPVPGWNSSIKAKSVSSTVSTSSSRISRPSNLLSSTNTTLRSDTASSLGSSSTAVSSLGLRRPTMGAGGMTLTSTLYAPTASSLARMRPPSVASDSKGRQSQSQMKGSLSGMPEQPKQPAAARASVTVSPSLRGTPNKFGFRGTVSPTSASASLKATSSHFALSPLPQMRAGAAGLTSSVVGSSLGSNDVGPTSASPAAAGSSKSAVVQPFSFSQTDFVNVASQTPKVKAAVLDPLENVDATSRPTHSDLQVTKTSAPLPRTPSTSAIRRPRISRSKVIAKLGEKRAAAAASSGPDRPSDIGVTGGTRTAIAPRRSKVRSSLQTRTRRSIAAPGSTGKERAILESYHRGQRKSEAAVRRQSRFRATARISSPASKRDAIA